jgi:cytochrome c5
MMFWRNIFLVTVIVLFSAIGTTRANTDGECKKLLTTVCNDCHNTDRVCESMGGTEKKWKAIIDWMISNGAELSDDQQTLMINCLMEPYDEAKSICTK